MLSDFSSKVSTNISSLGIDATTDSSEESDSGATETISGDELEKEANLICNLKFGSLSSNEVHDTRSVRKDKDFKNRKGESNKAETENLTSCEGDHESSILAFVAQISYLYVSNRGNLHSDETGDHRSNGANEEGKHSVRELAVEVCVFPALINSGENDSCEEYDENNKVGVLFLEEGVGTLASC